MDSAHDSAAMKREKRNGDEIFTIMGCSVTRITLNKDRGVDHEFKTKNTLLMTAF